MRDLQGCEVVIDMEAYMGILERHMLQLKHHFPRKSVNISSVLRECVFLTGSLQSCFLFKMYGTS